MSKIQYLKNRLPVILLNLLGILALSLFLLASDSLSLYGILFIGAVWLSVLALYLTAAYLLQKKRLDKLLSMTEQLKERYLIAELMAVPEDAREQVFYRILKLAEKSMLEKIEAQGRESKEYREYIEQWIHEVKTPITAMKLLCENNPAAFSRELLVQLEKINYFTEQALYYARSSHAEKDYSIRESHLKDIVHEAVSDNKYLLRQNHVKITVNTTDDLVYTDGKWVRFLLGQIIGNAVKYRTAHPEICFSTIRQNGQVLLSITDNGIGIPESDLPRIFEKGFTGQNGRIIQSSTGIGLYLCKSLCGKLGIGLTASSSERGTTITLAFPVNDFITGVQT